MRVAKTAAGQRIHLYEIVYVLYTYMAAGNVKANSTKCQRECVSRERLIFSKFPAEYATIAFRKVAKEHLA